MLSQKSGRVRQLRQVRRRQERPLLPVRRQPQQGDNSVGIVNGPGDPEVTNWENFLSANKVTAYALGIGSGLSAAHLSPIAYDGALQTQVDPILVTDLRELQDTLVAAGTEDPDRQSPDGQQPGRQLRSGRPRLHQVDHGRRLGLYLQPGRRRFDGGRRRRSRRLRHGENTIAVTTSPRRQAHGRHGRRQLHVSAADRRPPELLREDRLLPRRLDRAYRQRHADDQRDGDGQCPDRSRRPRHHQCRLGINRYPGLGAPVQRHGRERGCDLVRLRERGERRHSERQCRRRELQRYRTRRRQLLLSGGERRRREGRHGGGDHRSGLTTPSTAPVSARSSSAATPRTTRSTATRATTCSSGMAATTSSMPAPATT